MTTDDQQDDAATETVRDTLARLGFAKKRAILEVSVSLDPVPGWGNIPEDYRVLTQRLLDDAIPHYEPVVTLADSEQAVLVAKVAELEAHKAEWREAAQINKRQWMEAIDRALAAEATLAKVAALADEWDSPPEPTPWAGPYYADRLRASLASAGRPATSDGEDENGELCRKSPRHHPQLVCDLTRGHKGDHDDRCGSTWPASPVVAPSATDEDGA